ncbi:hypothetical protein FFWV33_00095 [Flavobacterium faecale]|uniref:Peptidoglycan endopeptidase n=1 Tax=Flavobacterium faecale TaxID=1355330 RepID=A0A2S1L8H9_9FLAO|nr:peptidoglycan endopeptidase [Flavobacterium faecale]AWG20033.1 hypothetical protein FFWV33_00095 [Flavobacterium faecale]
MKCFNWILVSVSLVGFSGFSQQKTTEHVVAKGETISKIAQQYNVSIKEIYELNPTAKSGIKYKSSLLIPVLGGSKEVVSKEIIHEVEAKESPYSISRKYGLTVDDLYKSNPSIKDTGLQIGQKIIISGGKEVKTEVPALKPINTEVVVSTFEGIDYEVLPKQTKYSIAKDYGITVAYLEKANPILQTEELKVGQKLLIPVKKYVPTTAVDKKEVSSIKEEITPIKKTEPKLADKGQDIQKGQEYEVAAKQTKYSIAKEHGVTVALLEAVNPILQTEELKIGQKIFLPTNALPVAVTQKTAEIVETKQVVPELQNVKTVTDKVVTPAVNEDKSVEHEVLAKQTKYGIAREYGITVAELDKANSFFDEQGLRIGQKIIIPAKNGTTNAVVTQTSTTPEKMVETPVAAKSEAVITHVVLPKETKYGIASDYGITVKELEKMNPKMRKKLVVGSVLTIQNAVKVNIPFEEKQKSADDALADEKKDSFKYSVEFADQLVETASDNIGIRYQMGGTTKSGFDCSGLMCVTYGAHDIQLPRTSLEQSRYGTVVDVDQARKGDLIFFKTRGGSRINHVGMVVESIDGDVKFIHASNSGVIISSIKESYYAKRVVQCNRVL